MFHKPCQMFRVFSILILLTGHIFCSSSQKEQEPEDSKFQKGMAFPSWKADQFCSAASDGSLAVLAQTTCTEWVQIVPTWYQNDRFSNQMLPDYDGQTARMECVRHAVQTSHGHGLKVMLKPHIDSFSGDWRGTFQPTEPEIWFANYTEVMETFAQIATEENVEILSIGCEFVELTTSEFTADWKELIQSVRKVYKGPLIYAANWGRESQHVEFWDALDFIGIDAYYELTNKHDPTLDELLSAWAPYLLEIESFHLNWQRPIVLTEIGYRSLDGANMHPWDWGSTGEIDLAEQALCYQAVIKIFGEKSWFEGIYWWNWEPDPSLGGPTDTGYTPQGKPVENVLKSWYCGGAVQKKGKIRR
jgi:hypothetical protein